jgi:hypothetical protein
VTARGLKIAAGLSQEKLPLEEDADRIFHGLLESGAVRGV